MAFLCQAACRKYTKSRDATPTELAIIVFVRRKLPLDQLDEADRLPALVPHPIDGAQVLVDVLETGPIIPLYDPAMYRPVEGGISISGETIAGSGTLGGWVTDNTDDSIVLLSNNHVIGGINVAPDPPGITQPGRGDGGRVPDDMIGVFKRQVPIQLAPLGQVAPPTAVDAPIGTITAFRSDSIRQKAPGIYETAPPKMDMQVFKRGRTTQQTVGVVGAVNSNVHVDYLGQSALLTPLIMVAPIGSGNFVEPGDSGAILMAVQRGLVPTTFPAIGLVFAMGNQFGYACRMDAVFSALNLSTVFGERELHREPWTPGWSTVAPFDLAGQPTLLSYKVGTGAVSIDRIRPDATGFDTLYSSVWTLGWTSIVPFLLDGQPHLLSYKAGTGQAAIDRVQPTGQGTYPVLNDTWTIGWTTIMPLQLGGQPRFLFYNVGTGHVSIDRLNADGRSWINTFSGTWAPGWTTFAPFVLEGQNYYIAYRAGDATAVIDRIRPDGSDVDTQYSATWSFGWTSIMPFTNTGTVQYLAYKAVPGTAVIDRVRSGGTGVDTVFAAQWTPGWTSLIPFTLDASAHFFGYKIGPPNDAILEILHSSDA